TVLHSLSLPDALPISRVRYNGCKPLTPPSRHCQVPTLFTNESIPDWRKQACHPPFANKAWLFWQSLPQSAWAARYRLPTPSRSRSEEHTSELQSRFDL